MKFTALIFLSACSIAMADLGYYFIGASAGFSGGEPENFDEFVESEDGSAGDNYASVEIGWGVNNVKISQTLSFEFINFSETSFNGNRTVTNTNQTGTNTQLTTTSTAQESFELESFGLMLNYKLYYNITDRFRIFGGAGIGWTYNEISGNQIPGDTTSELTITLGNGQVIQAPGPVTPAGNTSNVGPTDDWTFGYQFNIGLEFGITKNFSIIGQYRFIDTGEIEGSNITAANRGFFDIGARYYF